MGMLLLAFGGIFIALVLGLFLYVGRSLRRRDPQEAAKAQAGDAAAPAMDITDAELLVQEQSRRDLFDSEPPSPLGHRPWSPPGAESRRPGDW